MHFLTVFWKVLFACVPPTDYLNGWACFIVSIVIIGLLTAVIGDLASHFGCTIGLKDSVTAVVFVALGTSVPGEALWWSPPNPPFSNFLMPKTPFPVILQFLQLSFFLKNADMTCT